MSVAIARYNPQTPPLPVQPVIDAVVALLRASDVVAAGYVEAAEHVYAHDVPLPEEQELPPRRLVVREARALGGRRASNTGVRRAGIQVAAQIDADQDRPDLGWSARYWHEAVLRRAHAAIAGQRPDLTAGGVRLALPLALEREPGGAVYLPDLDAWTDYAEFSAVLDAP